MVAEKKGGFAASVDEVVKGHQYADAAHQRMSTRGKMAKFRNAATTAEQSGDNARAARLKNIVDRLQQRNIKKFGY